MKKAREVIGESMDVVVCGVVAVVVACSSRMRVCQKYRCVCCMRWCREMRESRKCKYDDGAMTMIDGLAGRDMSACPEALSIKL